jgi:hypothetical protein
MLCDDLTAEAGLVVFDGTVTSELEAEGWAVSLSWLG